jgi:hypothetical protein
MNQELEPVPKRTLRIVLLILLWALALVGSTSWPSKIGFAVGTLLILGTYRRFRLTPKSLMERWTVAFVNLPHRSFRLKRYSFLEVKYEPPTGILELLLFGLFGFIYGWIVDRWLPWIGGAYQIWLNNEADQRALAWQGNSQAMYERNLEKLQAASGLRVQMR